MTTQARIRELMLRELQWSGSAEDLTDDLELIEAHVIDSLDLVKLISLLEEEFAVDIPDEDLIPQNFATIREIARFVDAKRNG